MPRQPKPVTSAALLAAIDDGLQLWARASGVMLPQCHQAELKSHLHGAIRRAATRNNTQGTPTLEPNELVRRWWSDL